jgi:hypothetical protein
MKIAKLRRVGVYVLTEYQGAKAIGIKNVATGESGQYRPIGRLEDGMDALAELLESGIGLEEAIGRLGQRLQT